MHLHDVFTSCKLNHQKVRSLYFLPTEVVTKMRQQQRRVWCLNTKDQCNTAKMAGEWNARHEEPLQNKSAFFLCIFSWSQWLEIVRNVSFYTRLEDGYEFQRHFWIKQCWTPASWNHATSVRGRFDSTESGRKLDKSICIYNFYAKRPILHLY